MKNAIFSLFLAAVAVSCVQSTEEVVVEETVVDTAAVADSASLEVETEGEEAAAE